MATFEDKILGNDKTENYCSSSEDEAGYEDAEDGTGDGASGSANGGGAAAGGGSTNAAVGKTYFTPTEKWGGEAANTGPKGVIKDWQRFKQLETERNEDKERERLALAKRLAITAPTTSAEDAAAREAAAQEAELAELLGEDADGVLLAFQRQRMIEMMERTGLQPSFGRVVELADGDQFLAAIDAEHKLTTVVVHVYETGQAVCRNMDSCLEELAEEYRQVKFCRIAGTAAGLSRDFKVCGVPALLVYKAGVMTGNFVRVSDELGGEDFYTSDVESFLIEHALLPDKTLAPRIVGGKSVGGTAAAKAAADSSDDD